MPLFPQLTGGSGGSDLACRHREGNVHSRRRKGPMGYGVIGSPTDSGSVSLGSSPGTPALLEFARVPDAGF
ncbi:hypothetical protein MILUP08_41408 [Micromonospora lupini str. Lupac 08]|uniref:Uncharacterized protein n=1 Tax=Micromonospora lupini str. Lupac 08 TaxID=1150864 RepID=I0KY47_9ACTN|nr:hypothetical protein MILUP08_41408 [Micromonospora lupini str. Lupac 08]